MRTGSNETVSSHFLGSVVYVEKGLYTVSLRPSLLVIDGQQRLTTMSRLLEALARRVGNTEPLDGFSAVKIRNHYLQNSLESGDRRYKLILSKADRDSFISILEKQPKPKKPSQRIFRNFQFFVNKLEKEEDLTPVCRGLAKLLIVDIALDRERDNPQLIFESLNSTGKELSQADLIRNYVLMGLEPDLQTDLYQRYWQSMEKEFGQEEYVDHFDRFMRHYLTVKTGRIPEICEVYDEFKRHAGVAAKTTEELMELVADIRNYARYYCVMAFGQEPDPDLRRTLAPLRELKVDVPYPLLMELYEDYQQGMLKKEEFQEIIGYIESYVFRRAVCSIPTNSMNKTFATFARQVDKIAYLESVKAQFLLLPSYRRFPRDEEFKRELKTRDLYHFRNRTYWLRRMENYGRKEPVPVDEYTIEHIMPQNEELSYWWQNALGPHWREIQQKWLHTLGNLTLTGYNSEYGDRSFPEKRDTEGGFAESPLRLNRGLARLETWGEEQIGRRADALASKAVEVWPIPELSDGVLETYRALPKERGYSIQDHPYIAAGGPMESLFLRLRREILALDTIVSEEFLKLYVAYKAETNFVDVVPQAGQLRLSLNMPFSEINDPRNLCINVAGKGRWGNGEVEVKLRNEDEIPYVLGLIRQSLERQMGND